jgi:hypothetical protein
MLILSLLTADGHCYNQWNEYMDSCGDRAFEPIYAKIWLTIKELIIFGGMSFYFLKKGTLAFNLLSNKEASDD